MNDPELIHSIAQRVQAKNGRLLLVGGYVRDSLLQKQGLVAEPKDIDAEVYGLPYESLIELLSEFGQIDTVGASFGIIKLKNTQIDISIPRRDSKVGVGHKGFLVDTDPDMPIAEAAKRRDFTINAMAIDPLSGELIDPYGGQSDLTNRLLRATDSKLFADDSLRVLRAMQFAARFNMQIEPKTLALCQSLELSDLPPERIGEEWKKLLLKSLKPSIGLLAAKELGILRKLHPMFDTLDQVAQDSRWHPEGDVWQHTLLSVDQAAAICRREGLNEVEALELMLVTLCHDLGKATTTRATKESITSYGHETAGLEPTKDFLSQLGVDNHYMLNIPRLVANHMFPLIETAPTDAALRRLSLRIYPATITQLLLLAEADIKGRTGEIQDTSYLKIILDRAAELNISADKPSPIIQGRDLIVLGVEPGKTMGEILDKLYQAQLDGDFTDHKQGLDLARTYLQTL